MRVERIFMGPAIVTAMVLSAGSSTAQSTTAAADALFQQGRDEISAGNYESACAKFRQSDELDPALGTKLNLAECEAKLGHIATAWELYKTVEERMDSSDPRYAMARQKREALEVQVPKLQISLGRDAPTDTVVHMGKADLTSSAFGTLLPLDPGQTVLNVTAAGRAERRFTVTLEVGKVTKLEVSPGPALQSPAALPTTPLVAPVAPPADTSHSNGKRTLGYVFGGIGLAGLVVGGVAGVLTLSEKSTNAANCHADANPQWCTEAGRNAASTGKTYGAITTVGLGLGVVGVGLGTYFLVSSHKSGQPATALVTQGGPTGAHLALIQAW